MRRCHCSNADWFTSVNSAGLCAAKTHFFKMYQGLNVIKGMTAVNDRLFMYGL